MHPNSKIYVAGHRGLVGSAIVRQLTAEGFRNLVLVSHAELDLTDGLAVAEFFAAQKPEYVFLAAAKVGGIYANDTHPAEFIYQNLTIQNHVLHHSFLNQVKRVLFLGSSCIYPRQAPQPMNENHLLTGALEPTNQSYAVAKIAGIQMCWAYNRQYGTRFLPVMPTNLYGPGDNFDLLDAHVLPAMIRKFHLAALAAEKNWEAIAGDVRRFGPIPSDIKQALGIDPQTGIHTKTSGPEVKLWGSGAPYREFMYSDDLGNACVHVMRAPWEKITGLCGGPGQVLFNIGVGHDITIRELAERIARVIGFNGPVIWDDRMPEGTPRKLLDVRRIGKLGWQPGVSLDEGLRQVYRWYKNQV